jgi:hypothetical protein
VGAAGLRVYQFDWVDELGPFGGPMTAPSGGVFRAAWQFGPCRTDVDASGPLPAVARDEVERLTRWYLRTFQGQTLHDLSRAGRPPGSAHVSSVAEFADRIFPIIRNLVTAGERPTQAAVCERITATWPEYRDGRTTCAERQLRRWFAPYWADWETVVQAAMSSETD